MKKIMCDNCGSDNSRSYKYQKNQKWSFKDFCVNCLQSFVLENQVKLVEVNDSSGGFSAKKIIHG